MVTDYTPRHANKKVEFFFWPKIFHKSRTLATIKQVKPKRNSYDDQLANDLIDKYPGRTFRFCRGQKSK